MIRQEDKDFVEQGFQKLQERGWFSDLELEPSTITAHFKQFVHF